MNDLDTLIPQPRTVEGIEIRPLVVRQISPFVKALKQLPADVMARLGAGAVDPVEVAENCDVFMHAVAIATDRKAGEIGEMGADQLVNLVGAIVEINLDFFVRRLAPALGDLVTMVGRLSGSVGPMSSSVSSSTATGDRTSPSTP